MDRTVRLSLLILSAHCLLSLCLCVRNGAIVGSVARCVLLFCMLMSLTRGMCVCVCFPSLFFPSSLYPSLHSLHLVFLSSQLPFPFSPYFWPRTGFKSFFVLSLFLPSSFLFFSQPHYFYHLPSAISFRLFFFFPTVTRCGSL
ncbi:MAG: hypothetical protein JOS17DRAFT_468563 [Linnemannia elongata]|nr:MAG: hypothetical protein JOS17DRAFT_468563 [Linnemannia elongata]